MRLSLGDDGVVGRFIGKGMGKEKVYDMGDL